MPSNSESLSPLFMALSIFGKFVSLDKTFTSTISKLYILLIVVLCTNGNNLHTSN